MNNLKRNFLFASAVLLTAFASAQENGETFTTFKEGGHYFITASINGTSETPIMLESGIPALFVDSAFAVTTGCVDISEYPASDHMMNLNGRKFRITNEGDGKVRIGKQTLFEGPVFIMADYENPYKVAVPIHLLHNEADGGSRIVKFDLANECLQMQSKASLKEADKNGFSSYKTNEVVIGTKAQYQATGHPESWAGDLTHELAHATGHKDYLPRWAPCRLKFPSVASNRCPSPSAHGRGIAGHGYSDRPLCSHR